MIRKAATILFVTLLAMQPLVMLTSFTINEIGTLNIDNRAQLAQEAGSRLDPLDYTDHVPVVIDEASDWTSQGWPGAGTQGDPYVISGLRIHYDVGTPLIQVWNQDAYFVVRDCLLIQNSTENAVDFVNTTHALVEYSTVHSEGVAIYGNNAANTILDHVYANGTGACAYTTYFNGSLNVLISNSQFNSEDCGSILTMYCYNLTLTSNTLEGFTVGWLNLFSNYTTCTGLMVTGPDTSVGIDFDECYFASVSDVEVYDCLTGFSGVDVDFLELTDSFFDVLNGIGLYSSLNVSILSCIVSASEGSAVILDYCHYATVSGNNITNVDFDSNLAGLRIAHSENGTVDGNNFVDLGDVGIHIDLSLNILVTNNYFDGVDRYGIYVDFSHYITMTNNDYFRMSRDSSGYVIYVQNSDYATINSEYMEEILAPSITIINSDYGLIQDCEIYGAPNCVSIYIPSSADNWTIQDNYFETNWKGIAHFASSQNLTIQRNTFYESASWDTSSIAIQLLGPSDFEIINNTITNCKGQAMSLTSGERGLVEGNFINNTYQGIYSTIVNATMIGNTLHNVEKRGIHSYNVINTEILNNDIEGGEYGLYLSALNYPLISGNTIQNTEVGMHFETVIDGIIENNNMTHCGFSFYKQQGYHAYNHSVTNNFVNDLPFYYNVNGDGLSLDADSYGQIMLLNCTNSAISNGEIVNATYGIILIVGNNIDITNVALTAHHVGALFDRATNVTLEDCVLSESYFIAHYAHDFFVDNLTIQENDDPCSISDTQDFQILNSLADVGSEGFYILDSQDGLIQGNRFFTDGKIAVWLATSSQDIEIYDNEFKWCNVGVYGEGAFNINITLNDFHDNGHGAVAANANNWRIIDNTFFANEYTGLQFNNVVSPFVVNNSFMNIDENGWEDASTNFWDDGVDTGNYWYVYPLVSPHPIGGSGGSTDRYPMSYDAPTEPMLNEPEDIEYVEFVEGNEIIWIVADDDPRDWEVYVDGEFWAGDAWNFGNITVNIDGLSYGAHTVELIVWDLSNNNATDTVLVTVIDNTDPGISSPSNAFIFVGVSGNEISWTISDQNPDSLELYQDDVMVDSGSWWSTTWTYSHDLDGLAEGEYTFTLVIYDVDGNTASDDVIIYVLGDDVNPVINHPSDINMTEGTVGNYMIWTATDDFPSHYVVVENASVIGTGDWGGTSISLNIDGLPAGHYTFTITVHDSSGNIATDSVNITVIPEGGWPPITPPDYTLAIVAILGAAGIIAVVVVLIIMRKKKASAA